MDFKPAAFRLLRQLREPGRLVERGEPGIASQGRRTQKAAVDHLTESGDGSLRLVATGQVAGKVEKSFRVWAGQGIQLRDGPLACREVALQISP